jgi:hypothetical protein
MEASPMSVRKSFLIGLGGLLGTAAVRAWMGTLDYKVAYYDPAVDPALPECQGQKIYLFWHEYILFPFSQRGHCNLAMLLSRHRDAEVLSRAARHMGFEIVRGSTRRGGVAAIRELLRKSRHMHLAITPDGPPAPAACPAPRSTFRPTWTGRAWSTFGRDSSGCSIASPWRRKGGPNRESARSASVPSIPGRPGSPRAACIRPRRCVTLIGKAGVCHCLLASSTALLLAKQPHADERKYGAA